MASFKAYRTAADPVEFPRTPPYLATDQLLIICCRLSTPALAMSRLALSMSGSWSSPSARASPPRAATLRAAVGSQSVPRAAARPCRKSIRATLLAVIGRRNTPLVKPPTVAQLLGLAAPALPSCSRALCSAAPPGCAGCRCRSPQSARRPALAPANGQRVEQRLGRVLVAAVAGIDNAAVVFLGESVSTALPIF
jgi:hypothetical protein